MNRKTLIILGIALILGIVALVLYFSRSTPPEETPSSGSFPVVGEPATQSSTGTAPSFFDDPLDASSRPVEAAPRLVKITDGPVAEGVVALSFNQASSTEKDVRVRYVERASGNLYEYESLRKSIDRLTNQTIPGVAKAAWLSDGSRAYLRYFSVLPSGERNLDSYMLPVEGEGQALARNLSDIVPEGITSVLTLTSNANGSSVTRAGIGGIGGAEIFKTDIGRVFLFSTDRGPFIQTPASATGDSYAFFVARSGLLERVPTPTIGMSFLPSPDGTKALVSHLSSGSLTLTYLDLITKAQTDLPLATMTEKCAWAHDSLTAYCGVPAASPQGTFPDDWYQGVVGFVDQLWSIDFANRVVLFVADLPKLTKAPIDAVSLATDTDQAMLFFVNRNDGSLWSYEL